MRREASLRFKVAMVAIFLVAAGWITTRPNIYKPFSPYSSFDYGYKMATGYYPDKCPSIMCKVHRNGFWGELFSKD